MGILIKDKTFFYSAMNLHARFMKSRSKLAFIFGYSHEPIFFYSTSYTVPAFVARDNIERLGKHTWTTQYRWSPWQHIKMNCLFLFEHLYILMQSIYNQ